MTASKASRAALALFSGFEGEFSRTASMMESIVTVPVTFEKAPRIVVLTMGTDALPRHDALPEAESSNYLNTELLKLFLGIPESAARKICHNEELGGPWAGTRPSPAQTNLDSVARQAGFRIIPVSIPKRSQAGFRDEAGRLLRF